MPPSEFSLFCPLLLQVLMPLLSDRVREQIPWVQLSIESVLVVLSVLLALGVDAWYASRQEQQDVRRALRGIRAELTETKRALQARIPHHSALIDTLTRDTLRFTAPLALRVFTPDTEAWRTAQQTGTLGAMDYAMVAPIAGAYAKIGDLEFLARKTTDLLFDGVRYRGNAPNELGDFGGFLNDLKNTEQVLLRRINRALGRIESRHPSISSSTAP
jgi:type II secretory pathway pseudopilin PulG